MKILIDAGNTRLKWGLYHDGLWTAQGILDYQSPSPWAVALGKVVLNNPLLTGALIANGAGPSIGELVKETLHAQGVPMQFVVPQGQAFGVTNRYHQPAQLGADRWAALIAARALHTGAALVVCAGTATTIDLLDAAGCFQGGLILPGFDLMRRSLAQGTAALPFAEAVFQALPRSTEDAIFAGCLAAQVGAVRHLWKTLEHEPQAMCLVSGGAAGCLLPHLAMPFREVPNLVLEGLAVIDAQAERLG
jgi:type III pantothenate kinase